MEREKWGTNIGFILAALGSAIGLGNIWRYSYMVYENGGGAFLIPYWIATLVLGVPLMILEFSMGHRFKASAPKAFASVSRRWEWVGWWAVIFVMYGIVLYYIVIISWVFNYLIASFNLGWGGEPVNFLKQLVGADLDPWKTVFMVRPLTILGLALIWFLNWFIVYRGVEKGIEFANKIIIPLLVVLTLVLVVWSVNLPGAKEGLKFYLKPDWSRLKDLGVWIAAATQIFFSLSLGFGIMIAYASYLPEDAPLITNAFATSLGNGLYSFIAGFAVFSTLGYMAFKQGVPVPEVVEQGFGLAFVAYPKAISLLPFPHIAKVLFALLFFFILFIAGLSSSISIIEAFTSALMDKFKIPRKTSVTALAVTGFVGSLVFATRPGFAWMDIVDHFLNNYGLAVVALLEAIVVGYIFKIVIMLKLKDSRDYFRLVEEFHIGTIWDFLYTLLVPAVMAYLVFSSLTRDVTSVYGNYPLPAVLILGWGWVIATLIAAFVVSSRPWKGKI